MAALNERPQVGNLLADFGSLDLDGMELEALLHTFGLEHAGEVPEGTPLQGWRVLAVESGNRTIVGAPADKERQSWQLGHFGSGSSERARHTLGLYPVLQPRRASQKERANGLVLRWPEVSRSAPDLDLLAIDIVNSGHERWHPQGDSFMVFAELRQTIDPRAHLSYAYVGGMNPALPLDPGEYSRVRVVIDATQWNDAKPGSAEVHAILVDLGVKNAEPLHVELTEQTIRDHLPQRPAPGRPPLPG